MKQSTRFSNRKQTGLTLVELLVAMAIQFILLAAMVYVYTSSRVMFTVNEQLARSTGKWPLCHGYTAL